MDKGHRIERFKQTWLTIDPPGFNFAPRWIGFACDFYFAGAHYISHGLPFVEAQEGPSRGEIQWNGVVHGSEGDVLWKLVQTADEGLQTNTYELSLFAFIAGLYLTYLRPQSSPYQWASDRATMYIGDPIILNPYFDVYNRQDFSTPNYWQVRNNSWP